MTDTHSVRRTPHRATLSRKRGLGVLLTAAALSVGGVLGGGTAATAAPADPVIFADSALEDAVNSALGHSAGTPVTEAEAESLGTLNAPNAGITTLGGIEYFTEVTDINLDGNSIVDVTPLSGLTALTSLSLEGQSVGLPGTPLGTMTANPVIDTSGNPVSVTSSDAGFSFDSAANTWTFSAIGNKTLSWDAAIIVGGAEGNFTGTVKMRISTATAYPETPEVVQAYCMNGDVVYPQLTLRETDGIEYELVGSVVPGNTVTVRAVPTEGHHLEATPESGWTVDSDGILGELEISLEDPDCNAGNPELIVIDAPNGDLPVNDLCGPDNATWVLPTGENEPDGFTWTVAADGMLTAVAHDGFVFSNSEGGLDPLIREYGYAPDTNEACPLTPAAPRSGTLAYTGASDPAGGPAVAGALLLGAGGLLVLIARMRRRA